MFPHGARLWPSDPVISCIYGVLWSCMVRPHGSVCSATLFQYNANWRRDKRSEEYLKGHCQETQKPLFVQYRKSVHLCLNLHSSYMHNHTTIALYIQSRKGNYMIKLKVELTIGCIVSHGIYTNEGDLLLGPLVLFSDLLLLLG